MKKERPWKPRTLLVLGLITAIAPAAVADSNTVSYQGTLRDATLNPVADGGYPMKFEIFDSDTGGASLWGPEQYPSVATNNGRFSVYLGSILPLGTLFADHGMLWLEISADTGTGMEAYAPRVALASVPYAQHAKTAGNADTLDGLDASAFAGASHNHDGGHITTGTVNTDRLNVGTASTQVARGNHTHNTLTGPGGSPANAVVVDGAGNVGAGTSTPGYRLEVNGTFGFTGAGAISGQSTGLISRAPRVIMTPDSRSGCPPDANINVDLWTQTFTLTRSAVVIIHAETISYFNGRRDLGLFVDGVQRDRNISHTDSLAWTDSHTHWGGVLAAGSHTVSVRGLIGVNVFGCGSGYGRITTLIFE